MYVIKYPRVIDGMLYLIYGSSIKNSKFKKQCINNTNFYFRGLARDGKSSQDAFRIWYYRLDQLRSIMRHVPFIALSATVTSTSKLKIYSLLSFNNSNTHSVVKSPLKGKILSASFP